jgi:hypothetical protein
MASIRTWLDNHRISEQITFNGSPIRALVDRVGKSRFPVQGNMQPSLYGITIEVDRDDVPGLVAGKANGSTVTLINNKGQSLTTRVAEIISYDPDLNSYTLGLTE